MFLRTLISPQLSLPKGNTNHPPQKGESRSSSSSASSSTSSSSPMTSASLSASSSCIPSLLRDVTVEAIFDRAERVFEQRVDALLVAKRAKAAQAGAAFNARKAKRDARTVAGREKLDALVRRLADLATVQHAFLAGSTRSAVAAALDGAAAAAIGIAALHVAVAAATAASASAAASTVNHDHQNAVPQGFEDSADASSCSDDGGIVMPLSAAAVASRNADVPGESDVTDGSMHSLSVNECRHDARMFHATQSVVDFVLACDLDDETMRTSKPDISVDFSNDRNPMHQVSSSLHSGKILSQASQASYKSPLASSSPPYIQTKSSSSPSNSSTEASMLPPQRSLPPSAQPSFSIPTASNPSSSSSLSSLTSSSCSSGSLLSSVTTSVASHPASRPGRNMPSRNHRRVQPIRSRHTGGASLRNGSYQGGKTFGHESVDNDYNNVFNKRDLFGSQFGSVSLSTDIDGVGAMQSANSTHVSSNGSLTGGSGIPRSEARNSRTSRHGALFAQSYPPPLQMMSTLTNGNSDGLPRTVADPHCLHDSMSGWHVQPSAH